MNASTFHLPKTDPGPPVIDGGDDYWLPPVPETTRDIIIWHLRVLGWLGCIAVYCLGFTSLMYWVLS